MSEAWKQSAACRGMDPNLWFPDSGGPSTGLEAREVCAVCPVAAECLAWARSEGLEGIYGGLSFEQRKRGVTPERALAIARRRGASGKRRCPCGALHSRRSRWCSHRCYERDYQQRRYASDPEYAERKRQVARRYYEECGDYVRARVRQQGRSTA